MSTTTHKDIVDALCRAENLVDEQAKRIEELEAKCETLERDRDGWENAVTKPVADDAVREQMAGTRFPNLLGDSVHKYRDYLDAQQAGEEGAACTCGYSEHDSGPCRAKVHKALPDSGPAETEATDATTEPTRELDVDVIEFRFPRAPETIREAADGALEEYGLTDREAEWSRKYGLHLCAEVRRLRAELEAQNEWHPASEPPEAGVPIEIGEVDGRGRWDVDFGFFDGEDETYHASNGDPIPFAKYWRVFPTPPKGASIDV